MPGRWGRTCFRLGGREPPSEVNDEKQPTVERFTRVQVEQEVQRPRDGNRLGLFKRPSVAEPETQVEDGQEDMGECGRLVGYSKGLSCLQVSG